MRKISVGIFLLFVFMGAILGSILWLLLAPHMPEALGFSLEIGTTAAPWVLDMSVLTLTFGLALRMNLGSMIGVVLAILCYWRFRGRK
ncbi:MAG: DUF4321 domain-containing protein [Christensenellaceae bacterium]|nr:DUF4321 domain-containing protein [Christensenellaceae bacterium]